MIKLHDNGVEFDEGLHTYHKDGVELFGITRAISKYIHPEKYSGVSNDTMAQAAERGSSIHAAIELYCNAGIKNDLIPELEDFIKLKEQYELETVANEYIVTDNEYFASAIDYVCKTPFCKENEVVLVDFKATSSIDDIRLSVQLSIYKMLFELNNPDLKVLGLYCIWLPKEEYGNAKFVPVSPINDELVKALLDAYRNEEEFSAIEITKEYPLPVHIGNIESRIGSFITIGKAIDKYLKGLKATLLEEMTNNDVKSYKGEHLSISITKGYTKKGGYDANSLIALIDELLVGRPQDFVAEIKNKVEACKKPDSFVSDSLTLKYS